MSIKPRIIIAGGSGFLGRSLCGVLLTRGYEVVVLTRVPARAPAGAIGVGWDGRTRGDWVRQVDGAHAVVNLAGRNVNCRYTERNLAEINASRVDSVRVVNQAIKDCDVPPQALVQASTLAIYGDAGERWCDESAPCGRGVPVDTAAAWEAAFNEIPTPRTRRVVLRISFVLERGRGALKTLDTLTRCFLGGRAGTGRQYVSWIHVHDMNATFLRAIESADMEGIYNATSPGPVTNRDFMRALRRALGRPWAPPAPAWLAHMGAFLMRTEAVLALTGRRGEPKRLVEGGFEFRFRELSEALGDLYGWNECGEVF